ncbi:MAG: EutP/PduV family microcompartment system protein [Lachnospiraceae bacterium]|nr:EutP/PduV family microcompartment system protein [Lachnospiraceae bacterium]
MKKLFLMGRSEAGKTSLTQALKGEELHYQKTQYTNTSEDLIDSPGEYAESKHFSVGLACFSFEADVVAVVQAADEPFNLFGACLHTFILRPLIGVITKTDSPYANVPMIEQWMENMGCERIFHINNVTREGVQELLDYLHDDDLPPLTLEQAKYKQQLGYNEWEPLPEGISYPQKS